MKNITCSKPSVVVSEPALALYFPVSVNINLLMWIFIVREGEKKILCVPPLRLHPADCLFAGLPQTKLGGYLETRVNDYLKRQSHLESGDVTIRVVHVSDRVVEVKPGMKSR